MNDTQATSDGAGELTAAPDQQRIRLRLDLAYCGSEFHGWQVQPNLRTVQGQVQEMLARLLDHEVCLNGAGRTDAGVHARGQVCHLDVASEEEAIRLEQRLQATAPPDLAVLAVRRVSPAFDARFSALARRYSYHLLWDRDVFREMTAFRVERPVDRAAMSSAAGHFQGTHDYSSFCKTGSLRESGNECTVDLCRFHWQEDSAIFHVRANRFLHHMVRNMVGTLIEIGLGSRAPDDVRVILAARDRCRAGRKAPARGLFLEDVIYPTELLDQDYRPPASARDGNPDGDAEGETA